MKATSQNIYNTIKQVTLVDNYNELKNRNPAFIYQETSLSEAYDDYVRVSDLIIKTSENNLFDSITFTRRNQIWGSISNIKNQLDQIKNFGYDLVNNGNVVNLANSVIQLTINLVDAVETSNLYARSIGLEDYKEEVNKLSEVRKKYQDLLSILTESENVQKNSTTIFNSLTQVSSQVNEILNQANEKIVSLNNLEVSGKETSQKILDSNNLAKESEKEIEAKKLNISTFSQNIEEYKIKIDELTNNAKNIIEKEKVINDLILSAETALNLKSAQGISAAFSSQYDTAKDSGVLTIMKLKFNSWIFGATLFILSAIGITIWIATGQLNSDSNGISLIIARIVAVAISITGATFCAKQYIKQQNIAEDYAYKAVLSKSIIAFTDEIKKKDDQKVAQYLTKVLDEIHKDPLRGREINDDKGIGLNAHELVDKLMEIIKKK